MPGLSAIEGIQNHAFSRTYRRDPPESDARMAWDVLDSLREHASGKAGLHDLGALRDAIARSHGAWRPLREVRAGNDGVFIDHHALVALIALRSRMPAAIALVWLFLAVGLLDTVNAIIQSMRFSAFTYGLGVNWVIVTAYVPALLVSSVLIFIQLRRPGRSTG